MQRDIEEPFNRTSLEKLYKALNVFPNDERLSGQELHEQLRYAVFWYRDSRKRRTQAN